MTDEVSEFPALMGGRIENTNDYENQYWHIIEVILTNKTKEK